MESRRYFFDAWGNLEKEHGTANVSLGEKPRVWKTIGDEILYVKLLTDHRQLCSTLSCWMKAVQQLRSFVKSKDSRLDVKSTAWTAGFPLKNKEVVVSSASDHEDDADGNFFVASARLLMESIPNTIVGFQAITVGAGLLGTRYKQCPHLLRIFYWRIDC